MPLKPLLQALANNHIVVTPTNRLQREILWLYTQNNSLGICPKPLCFSYDNFLKDWFTQDGFHHPKDQLPRLLDDWSFKLLFKKMASNIFERELTSTELQQALNAFKNCHLVDAYPKLSDVQYNKTYEQFRRLYTQMNDVLVEMEAISSYHLASHLKNRNYPRHSPQILWACFDYFHPAQQKLQEHLNELAIEQIYFDIRSNPAPKNHAIYTAKDAETEEHSLISWLKQQLDAGKKRIGLVLPDLSQYRDNLYPLLKQHFNENILHFSLGRAIHYYPIIKHALGFLKLDIQALLSKEDCRLLLLSPFIHIDEASKKIAQALLLKHPLFQEPFIPFQAFLDLCQKKIPALYARLSQLENYPVEAPPSKTLSILSLRLQQLGFPGNQFLTDENHQVLIKFYQLLEKLAQANEWISTWSLAQALSELEQACAEEIYQPPQNHDGIHIMGWLESSGFCGDALWIGHLQSHLIPQNIQFSNLLPIAWQKTHQLPRTNQSLEFKLAQQMLERLQQANPQVVLSNALEHKDEPMWPSPICPKLKIFEPLLEEQQVFAAEIIDNDYHYPLEKTEILRGGSQLLATHATCPFQAFAKYRLHSPSSVEENTGLNPLERGQLMHQIMHNIWANIKDQNHLKKMSAEELEKLIKDNIKAALSKVQRPYSMQNILEELEELKLYSQISNALEYDKTRPHFSIHGLEQSIKLEIDDFKFELRYDRIDRLENGKKCVIDYKSHIPSPLPWNQERPIHPQILMYALADDEIKTLLFIELSSEKTEVSGFSEDDWGQKGFRQSKEAWDTLHKKWHSYVQELIAELKTGHCPPKPVSDDICKKCNQKTICRLD